MNNTPIDANGLLVVVCTYNEIENLPQLVNGLRENLAGAHILIVDDNSPDGTGLWATEQSKTHNDLFCIVRGGKRGLGSAAIEGLGWGLSRGYRWLATMDSDFSHDPKSMPDLFAAASIGTKPDVVIGSRYVSGGEIQGWPWNRRLASKLLNGATRLLLRIPAKDCTGAMRIYRADKLRGLDLSVVRSTDYGYLEELLYRVHESGGRIVEVPITFRDRRLGKSKASWKQGLSALGRIVGIRLKG